MSRESDTACASAYDGDFEMSERFVNECDHLMYVIILCYLEDYINYFIIKMSKINTIRTKSSHRPRNSELKQLKSILTQHKENILQQQKNHCLQICKMKAQEHQIQKQHERKKNQLRIKEKQLDERQIILRQREQRVQKEQIRSRQLISQLQLRERQVLENQAKISYAHSQNLQQQLLLDKQLTQLTQKQFSIKLRQKKIADSIHLLQSREQALQQAEINFQNQLKKLKQSQLQTIQHQAHLIQRTKATDRIAEGMNLITGLLNFQKGDLQRLTADLGRRCTQLEQIELKLFGHLSGNRKSCFNE